MCIALISTAHPDYELIIIDNRDEYLHRPTAPAGWWQDPNSHVLGSRDLARPEQGTWMGVTKQGRVAVLTNYREPLPFSSVSRGAIVNDFLTEQPQQQTQRTTRQFVTDMIDSQIAKKAGGFSLVCGNVGEPLAIISNRMADHIDGVTWIAKERGETVGLSNTVFSDRSWPKIVNGELLMKSAIDAHIAAYANSTSTAGTHQNGAQTSATEGYEKEKEDDLINKLFNVLTTDTLPRLPDREFNMDNYMGQLKESIFIPLLGERAKFEAEAEQLAQMGLAGYMSGLYGTQKQTILLVDGRRRGRVRYVERSLYDGHVHPIPIGERDKNFEFMIEK